MNNTISQKYIYVSGTTLIIVSALFFVLFQNMLFFSQAWRLIQNNSVHDVLFFASMPILLFFILNIIFSIMFLPIIRKPILITFLLVGAAINYFMFSFNIVIDGNMVENTLATNPHEAMDLITFKLVLWFVLLGVLPALWVYKIKIKPIKAWWKTGLIRLINIVISILIIVLIAALFYKDYASLFRNNKVLVKMLVPSNAVAGVIKVIDNKIDANRPFIDIGQDAKKGVFIQSQPKKTLMILVVGETARAENFSLGGYTRETNLRLAARNNVIYFDNVSSCGTATAVSLPCMFSNMPRSQYRSATANHQAGVLDVLATAGVNVFWRENDGGCKGVCDRVLSEDVTRLGLSQYCKDRACLDEILLHQLEDYIDKLQDDALIVLHQMGSHGPSYHQRYTKEFRTFTPTCDTNSIQDCDTESLVNTYDNTIVYTDAFLDNTIKLLEKYDDTFSTMMLYISDHGESLGENGLYLHGTPYAFAPSQQTHVPLLTWMSQDYQLNHKIDAACLADKAKNELFSHDNLFHSLLGLFDIQTTEYQNELDIFKQCRKH